MASRIYGYAVCFFCILVAFTALALLALTAKGWRHSTYLSPPVSTIATDTTVGAPPPGYTLVSELEEDKRNYEQARAELLRESNYVELAAYVGIFLLALVTFGFHWRWLQRLSG